MNISWNDTTFYTVEEFNEYLIKFKINKDSFIGLDISSVYLKPLGPKEGSIKPTLVNAINGKYISGEELLFNAFNIQVPYIRELSEGIGIYRSGVKNNIPSYYIGHYHDLAGSTKQYEESVQKIN